MQTDLSGSAEFSAQIARAIRDAILSGALPVDGRLPSEAELAVRFGVSRPTVREALKRLAAQNLIRTQRGAGGGAFVARPGFDESRAQLVGMATLLLSLNAVDFETACEARFTLERGCLPLVCKRRTARDLANLRAEVARQSTDGLGDGDFCASDVAFHMALVAAAGNPVLSWHLSGAIEAMQPLMNMITYTTRSRARIVALHEALVAAIDAGKVKQAQSCMDELAGYTSELGAQARDARAPAPK